MKTITTMMIMHITICLYAPVLTEEPYKEQVRKYIEQMDQKHELQKILMTIRTIESSGGNYSAIGASGEYGAYQFTIRTWRYWCKKLIGEIIPIQEPANQDTVAMLKIRYLKDRGLTLDQIASFWNSGRIHYEGRTGRNRYGVYYDVPGYVERFLEIYEAI